MNPLASLPGAPFDLVFDVGGNIGEFAEAAWETWPAARIVSFEPIPGAADANIERAAGRWQVERVALSDRTGGAYLNFCENQHTASTLQDPGPGRRLHLGIVDRYQDLRVWLKTLDSYGIDAIVEAIVVEWELLRPRVLVKIDVEGHELQVLRGGPLMLARTTTVVCEVQNDPTLFVGSASPAEIDGELQTYGLRFAGLHDAYMHDGRVLQFDGVWTRDPVPVAHG